MWTGVACGELAQSSIRRTCYICGQRLSAAEREEKRKREKEREENSDLDVFHDFVEWS
jgi:hypothetical protein